MLSAPRILAGGGLLGLVAFPGLAQAGGVVAATLTNTSAEVVAASAGPGIRLIIIDNELTTDKIACRLGAAAALNTAGSITVAPYATSNPEHRVTIAAPPNVTIHDALNCISANSGLGSPATIFWE